MNPVVLFRVDGQEFRTIKRFNVIKTTRVSGLSIVPIKAIAQEDNHGNLLIKMESLENMRDLAEKLWPVGSPLIAYYNPKNPKINYVDEPISNTFIMVILFIIWCVRNSTRYSYIFPYKLRLGYEMNIYYQRKVFSGIYDDRFLVKLTKSVLTMMSDANRELLYEGAREMLLVDNIDNPEFLQDLVQAMVPELPAVKKKKRG